MVAVRYHPDGRHGEDEVVQDPTWADVAAAVRRMDNYCFPIVQLDTTDDAESGRIFNVIGGGGRWALFHHYGEWLYEDPAGGDEEVRLWDSDQGYFCQAKNVLTDVEKVLRIVRAYYDTGSYDALDAVE